MAVLWLEGRKREGKMSMDGWVDRRTGEFLHDDKELVALGRLGVEGLVDGEMLLLEGEDLVALDVGEGYIGGK